MTIGDEDDFDQWWCEQAWKLDYCNVLFASALSKPGGRDFSTSQSASLVNICKQLQASKPGAWYASSCKVDSASVHSSTSLCLSHLSIKYSFNRSFSVKTNRVFALMSMDYRQRVSMETALKGTFYNERSDCEREAEDVACIIALGWTQVLMIMTRKWSWPGEWDSR